MRASSLFFALFALAAPATAAIGPTAVSTYSELLSGDLDQWKRIDFRTSGRTLRNKTQIQVVIRTKGPRMQGLIRVPGAPASNFDTGNGLTTVELINTSSDSRGHAGTLVLEILFAKKVQGQFFELFAADTVEKAE